MANHGLLIDPRTKTVTRVELPESALDWRALVSPDDVSHHSLRPASIDGIGIGMVCDENGMYRKDQVFWAFAKFPDRVFAGRGLLYEFNIDGDTTSGCHFMPPEMLAEHIVWRDQIEVAGEETTTDEIDDPIFGRLKRILTQTKFRPKP